MKEKASTTEKALRILLIPATIGGLAVLKGIHEKAQGPEVPELTKHYTVQPGDTAQGIADRYLPPGADLRPLGDVIQEEAGDDGLMPGEDILVPEKLDHSKN